MSDLEFTIRSTVVIHRAVFPELYDVLINVPERHRASRILSLAMQGIFHSGAAAPPLVPQIEPKAAPIPVAKKRRSKKIVDGVGADLSLMIPQGEVTTHIPGSSSIGMVSGAHQDTLLGNHKPHPDSGVPSERKRSANGSPSAAGKLSIVLEEVTISDSTSHTDLELGFLSVS